MKTVKKGNYEFEDFSKLTKLLKKFVYNPFINYIIPAGLLKSVLKNSKSELAHECLKAAGSWKTMQLSYDKYPPKDFIDYIVTRMSSFPVGLRNRKKIVVSKMVELINRYKDKDQILMVGIGAGRACNALEAMKLSGLNNVRGYFVDIDDEAMPVGKEIAKMYGLTDRVKFIKDDAVNLKNYIPRNADILKLIGIIEYLTDNQVKELLKIGFENLAPNGTLITHSIQPSHGIDPFLKRVFGLNLFYRTSQQVIKMLEETGFDIMDTEIEPLGIYEIITASKKQPVKSAKSETTVSASRK